MSTRNGTSSVADPQHPRKRLALPLGEMAKQKEEVFGDGSKED
jgi:hypothetical protein